PGPGLVARRPARDWPRPTRCHRTRLASAADGDSRRHWGSRGGPDRGVREACRNRQTNGGTTVATLDEIRLPTRLWHRTFFVTAVESEVVAGRARPLSVTFLAVSRWFITKKIHRVLDWTGSARTSATPRPAPEQRAQSSSSRRTGGARRGSDPGAVVEQAHRLLSHAADEGVPVVVHTLTPGLEALLDALAPQ